MGIVENLQNGGGVTVVGVIETGLVASTDSQTEGLRLEQVRDSIERFGFRLARRWDLPGYREVPKVLF